MLVQCPNLVWQLRRVHCSSPQKGEWIYPSDQWKNPTKSIESKLVLFPKMNRNWPCIKSVNSWCTMGSCIMHSSLHSSCIMLHEPTEIHALTYTEPTRTSIVITIGVWVSVQGPLHNRKSLTHDGEFTGLQTSFTLYRLSD